MYKAHRKFLNGEQKGILDAYDNTESISCGSLLSKHDYEIKFYAKDEFGNQSDPIIETFTTLGDTELVKVSGLEATDTEAGYLECYMCESCKYYYEDSEGKKLIGDAEAYETWKLNAGKIDKLEPTDPSDDNKGKGGLVVLIIVIILVVLLGAYACGYFFLYRKGKLDNSGIKVIYSFLPKSKEEK